MAVHPGKRGSFGLANLPVNRRDKKVRSQSCTQSVQGGFDFQ
jgi:hypothetical protein